LITVFDIGSRFGIHPSWEVLLKKNLLNYHAFEIDPIECSRLKNKYRNFPNYYIHNQGFSDANETVELNVLTHKGQSSFLQPNLNSMWFGKQRKEDSKITEKNIHKLTTLDQYCNRNGMFPDFLKIDTEGYDFKILQGITNKNNKLEREGGEIFEGILAISCEVYFEEVFINVPLFDKIFRFLIDHNFTLANLQYQGAGLPQSYFCPNPNKYGLISGCEAIFISNFDKIELLTILNKKKLALFCFYNNLEDVSHSILYNLAVTEQGKLVNDDLWLELKRQYALSTKKMSYMPSGSFQKAKTDFQLIFKEEYPDQHHFYENEFLNPA